MASHRSFASHATVGLIAGAVVLDDLPRTLFDACQQGTKHDQIGSGRQGLHDVAAVPDAAIGDQRDVSGAAHHGTGRDGRKLGHTRTGNNARGADAPRTDSNFDRARTRVDETPCPISAGDIAGDQRYVRMPLPGPMNGFDDLQCMAMCGVDGSQVNAGLNELVQTREGFLAHADGGRATQLPLLIGDRVREKLRIELGPFDLMDFVGLGFRRQIAMNDPDAAQFCQGDSHWRFSHSVHGRRHHGNI